MKKLIISIVLLLGFINSSSAFCLTEIPAQNPNRMDVTAAGTDSGASTAVDPCIPVVTVIGTLPTGYFWGSNGNGSVGSGGFAIPTCRGACYDDGSRGMQQVDGRQPGCLDEQLYMAKAIADILANGPIGTFIMSGFGDPLFADPNWQKWSTKTIKKVTSAPFASRLNFQIEMHYMYNTNTKEIAQTKLKNSFEFGCVGIVTSL